jgi:hypothetical protein
LWSETLPSCAVCHTPAAAYTCNIGQDSIPVCSQPCRISVENSRQPPPGNTSWACGQCTYLNNPAASNCTMCGVLKPVPQPVPQQWVCSVCTLLNPPHVPACSTCRTPRR